MISKNANAKKGLILDFVTTQSTVMDFQGKVDASYHLLLLRVDQEEATAISAPSREFARCYQPLGRQAPVWPAAWN